MKYSLILLFGFGAPACYAQETAPPDLAPSLRFSYGFRAGLGLSAYTNSAESAQLRPSPTLIGSYNVPLLNCWVGASGALEFRPTLQLGYWSSPYATGTVFLRTGHGPNRAHLLAGLGRSWALGTNPPPRIMLNTRAGTPS